MNDHHLQLGLLRELQELEQSIAGLETAVRKIPEEIQAIDAELETARAESADLENRRKELDEKRRDLEARIEDERERQRKIQGRQLEVKTNKEYSALLQEIEAIKGTIDRHETEILELMETGEAMGEKVREGAERLREREAEADRRKRERNEELERLKARLAALREERKRLSVEIPHEWASEYNRIKAARGTAVVPLNGNACSACNHRIMPQLLHEIRHGREIKTCPHCQRILYASQEEPSAAETADSAEPKRA